MSAAKYRKRPVTIDAMHWDGTATGATPIIDWVLDGDGTARYHDNTGSPDCHGPHEPFRYCGANPSCGWADIGATLAIDTLEGVMTASPGDWVIRGIKGEHYPCRGDIFEQTYEPVEA